MNPRFYWSFTIVIALLFSVASADNLRIRLETDIKNMDPAHWFSNIDQTVAMPIFSGLVIENPNTGEVELDLATSLEQSDDGLQVHFALREGVQCHRGLGELTASDVKFSFERFLDPDNPSPYADDWQTLDHVEVIDDYHGTIHFSEPFAPLWTSTLPRLSGAVVCEAHVEQVGFDAFGTDPVGSGPYEFVSWSPDQQIILKRNDAYYGDTPEWDEIRFVIIKDEQAAEIAIESGSVDVTRIPLSSVFMYEHHPTIEVDSSPGLSYSWIGMNVEHPKLADVRVREAITLAIDVPSILLVAYEGQAERAHGMIAPGLLGALDPADAPQRNVERARELLAEAGAEGLSLRIDLADTSEYRIWAEIAQQNLAEVGIDLAINPMDTGSFWEIGLGDAGQDVELFTMSFAMQPDPSWATVWFTCNQIGDWNWMRWCSEEFDAMHKQGLVELDEDVRDQMYKNMQQLMIDDAVGIWITNGATAYLHRADLTSGVNQFGVLYPHYVAPK